MTGRIGHHSLILLLLTNLYFLFCILSGIFVNLFFLAYVMSPRFCHRFVGYLEEEAVKTYTHCLEVYIAAFLTAFSLVPLSYFVRNRMYPPASRLSPASFCKPWPSRTADCLKHVFAPYHVALISILFQHFSFPPKTAIQYISAAYHLQNVSRKFRLESRTQLFGSFHAV